MKELAAAATADEREDELGDVLFAAVNTARMMGIDAEQALSRSAEKFARRAKRVEELACGKELRSLTAEELDACWKQAKKEV